MIREEVLAPALGLAIPMILLPIVLHGSRWQKVVSKPLLLFVLAGLAISLANLMRAIIFFQSQNTI